MAFGDALHLGGRPRGELSLSSNDGPIPLPDLARIVPTRMPPAPRHDPETRSITNRQAISAPLGTLTPRELTTSPPPTTTTASPNRNRQLLIILSSLLLTFTGCGLNFAFGVYQSLYESLDGPFGDASPAQIDLIGTLAVSLMTMLAPLANTYTKTHGPRTVTLIGGVLFLVANIAASYGQHLWHFVLSQGLLLGCATCLTYIPAVTIAPGWFDARRGLAMGLILSGTGLGGVAWAPLLRYLNSTIGFRATLRVTGLVAFILITASAFVLAWPPGTDPRLTQDLQTTRRRGVGRWTPFPRANYAIIRSRPFAAHATAALLQAGAYYTPVYFFSTYAASLGYSDAAGANFIALSNACNFSGKIVVGWLADRYGRLNALVVCTALSAVATLGLWLPSAMGRVSGGEDVLRKGLFITFTCLYGLTASAYVSLFPTALAEQFGIVHFASVNGLLYMIRGVGTLVGTPVAGALIRGSGVGAGIGRGAVGFGGTIGLVGGLLVGATVAVGWARVERCVGAGVGAREREWRWVWKA